MSTVPRRGATRHSRARKRWWWPALAIMGAIWWLSSGADTPGPPLPHPWDWAAHFVTYLALAFALTRATGRPGLALLLAAWWGALDEVHQAFVPGREAGVQDWLFDLAGAWAGSWLAARRWKADPPEAPELEPAVPEPAAPVAVLLEFPR